MSVHVRAYFTIFSSTGTKSGNLFHRCMLAILDKNADEMPQNTRPFTLALNKCLEVYYCYVVTQLTVRIIGRILVYENENGIIAIMFLGY